MDNDSTQNQVNNQSNDGVALNSLKNKLGTFLGAGNRRFILGGAVIILVVLISVFAFSKKTQNIPQKVSPNAKDALLVTVGDQKIYKSDVQKAAAEQYVSTAIDNKVLQVFLDLAIEHTILDQQAKKLNIIISNSDVQSRIRADFKEASGSSIPEVFIKQTRYDLLKEKIISKRLESREANYIKFWTPSFTYESTQGLTDQEKNEGKIKRIAIQKALDSIEISLKSGLSIGEVAKNIYDNFPLLKTGLAVNGLIFNPLSFTNLERPALFIYDPKNAEKEFDKLLFSMKPKEVKEIIYQDGSGGAVIQLVAINNGFKQDYNSWLNDQKKTLVKQYKQL